MTKSSWRHALVRHTQIETCEERRFMTADPLLDFHLDYRLEQQVISNVQIAALTTSAAVGAHGLTGAGQTVVVIDSGIAYDHPALGGGLGSNYRVVGGWDFAENDANPYDDGPAGAHGTHVAGIIGSNATTAPGLASGVDLVALRVFNDSGNGSFAWVEEALQWVHSHRNDFENPITTINLSIGATWNATSVPAWSMIEDELAQLKADGIFISVAAGNSFSKYNAAGLSYPAASSYVVPVSAVDASGNMSSFSQRQERVIAAPGQAIRSTVPDYVGNLNGRPDDYATFSGTSMAAPYVAGASVLIREALQASGAKNINQDTIYNVMRSTADWVFDPATNQSYTRLNLDRALSSIAPAPVEPAVTELGSVDFKRLSDVDTSTGDTWYSFTAARSGQVTAELLVGSAGGNVDLEIYNGSRQLVASSAKLSGDERIDVTAAAGDTFFVRLRGANSDVDLRLTNLVSKTATTTTIFGTSGNDTLVFSAGSTHVFTINGVRYEVAGKSQTVTFNGGQGHDTATLNGTAGNETATLSPTTAELAGAGFRAIANSAETISVNAGAGADRATLRDSAGNDVFTATPTWAMMTGSGYSNLVVGFDRVDGKARSGSDTAKLWDSIGNDRLLSSPNLTSLYGDLFYNTAQDFDWVEARATAGGQDEALFTDSAGNDTFVLMPGIAHMYGSAFSNYCNGFERIVGQSLRGGNDTAYLYDSLGDDLLDLQGDTAALSGAGYFNQADDFNRVRVVGSGGADTTQKTAIDFIFDRLGTWR